jgi:uncharacterized OB-fold protein
MLTSQAQAPPLSLFRLAKDRWTEPFWQAAAEERLVAARCGRCKTFRHPPGPYCANCLSQQIEYVNLSGKGEIYSFTVVRRTALPGLAEIVPYVPAVITLADAPGIRMVGAIVGCDVSEVRIGRPVVVSWVHGKDASSFPHWRLETP